MTTSHILKPGGHRLAREQRSSFKMKNKIRKGNNYENKEKYLPKNERSNVHCHDNAHTRRRLFVCGEHVRFAGNISCRRAESDAHAETWPGHHSIRSPCDSEHDSNRI